MHFSQKVAVELLSEIFYLSVQLQHVVEKGLENQINTGSDRIRPKKIHKNMNIIYQNAISNQNIYMRNLLTGNGNRLQGVRYRVKLSEKRNEKTRALWIEIKLKNIGIYLSPSSCNSPESSPYYQIPKRKRLNAENKNTLTHIL